MKLLIVVLAAVLCVGALAMYANRSSAPIHETPAATVGTAVTSLRVFFGHQSVGANVLDGIRAIAPDVRITTSEAPNAVPGIVETLIGRNGDPDSKLDHFTRVMTAMHDKVDVALMKFCYVDFGPGTDLARVQQKYRETFARLAADHPRTRFVHATVPLTITQRGPKAMVKRVLGRPVFGEAENPKRAEFNEWLRRTYAAEPIFDIAAVESRTPSGEPVTFSVDGRSFPMLYDGYSDDGQHLAESGRRIVAAAFLSELDRAAAAGDRR